VPVVGHRGADLTRREALFAIAGSWAVTGAFGQEADTPAGLRALEARAGGRVGVYVLDTGTGRAVGHREDERFAMCSTFKLPLAAVILREADAGRVALDEQIRFSAQDMVSFAPVTGRHVAEGRMTVAALAEAAQVTSDNVAANLLLQRLGGPAAFTAMLRATGDVATRLDRPEPMVNLVVAGDERDTTTPRAMATTMSKFLAGDLLSRASRDRLLAWMEATATGAKRIRAGLPAGWRAGDKTGTGMADAMTDKYNDVAIAWPPGRPPLLIAAYFDSARRSQEMRDEDQEVLADVGRLAAAWAVR
jgi:beta-lactamase class A